MRWVYLIVLAIISTIWDGLTGDKNDTNWVSVGIGWGIGGSCIFSFKNMQKQGSSMHERCEKHVIRHTKKKGSESLSETDGFCSSEHGLQGIGLGGPLSVVEVSWAASKFNSTSYYSVHQIILSSTHICKPGWLSVRRMDNIFYNHKDPTKYSIPTCTQMLQTLCSAKNLPLLSTNNEAKYHNSKIPTLQNLSSMVNGLSLDMTMSLWSTQIHDVSAYAQWRG